MAIRFVTDSASDILPEEAEKLGLVCVPLLVRFGDNEYQDGITISHKEFYEKLIESDVLPQTSQATPVVFEEVFEKLTSNGDEVIAIMLSSELSGTYQSACIAAQEFEGKVFVVDSRNVTLGQRNLVMRGFQLAKQGMAAKDIVECLNKDKEDIRLLAVLDTLEYLRKGGRVSAVAAIAGELLSIKPAVCVRDGKVEQCGKARGSKNGNNLLRKMIEGGNGIDFDRPYCVAYSGLSDHLLQKYIKDSSEIWDQATSDLPIATVGSVIGTHVGPGAIAVSFFEKKV